MEFDESKVYTALNADKLKVGSKVILAKNLHALQELVQGDNCTVTLLEVREDIYQDRFYGKYLSDGLNAFGTLAYLVSAPGELKWTDLKIGDVIAKHETIALVNQIDTQGTYDAHIRAGESWISDPELSEWKKVEDYDND